MDLRAAFTGMLHRLRTDGVWREIVKLLNDEGAGTPVLSYEAGPTLAIRTRL
ncbi:hypothetical protein [Streptomyces sp. NPDC056660]|uniref:hypothetical protein n=1 Tax=Streptomyces sp. NPDC056660 TaxID=3345897 RepID=UPI0036C6000D